MSSIIFWTVFIQGENASKQHLGHCDGLNETLIMKTLTESKVKVIFLYCTESQYKLSQDTFHVKQVWATVFYKWTPNNFQKSPHKQWNNG